MVKIAMTNTRALEHTANCKTPSGFSIIARRLSNPHLSNVEPRMLKKLGVVALFMAIMAPESASTSPQAATA